MSLDEMHGALLSGNAKKVVELVNTALAAGTNPQELVTKHMVPAMSEAGAKFEANEIFVPELLLIARAMKSGLEIIRPLLAKTGAKPTARVAIGTVKGDLHDIGKNLVASMLEGGGFEVVDLGVDVSPEKFVAAVREKQVNIIALSALLTTTMPFIKHVIDALVKEGLRDKVKVVIGGAPVTQEFADEVGADGYSDNANGAVNLARKLVA